MDAQSWSYKELTDAVEAEIALQLQKAHIATSEVARRSCQDYAVGTYFAWEAIMRAHLTERRLEDAHRLAEMVSPPEPPDPFGKESVNALRSSTREE